MAFNVQIKTHKVKRWQGCAAHFACSLEAERHAEFLKAEHPQMIVETRVEPTKQRINARWEGGRITWVV